MRVQVNFSDDMIQRIDNLCKLYGCNRSQLISVWVGEKMMTLDLSKKIVTDAFSKMDLGDMLKNQMSIDDLGCTDEEMAHEFATNALNLKLMEGDK